MYAMLEREAKDAGLLLRWPQRLPNSRRALAAAEWARRHQPGSFPRFQEELFAAHFVLGEDLEDTAVQMTGYWEAQASTQQAAPRKQLMRR